jgi:hypothetical protein
MTGKLNELCRACNDAVQGPGKFTLHFGLNPEIEMQKLNE